MMRTPNIYAHHQNDPFTDVPNHFQDNKADILYVTDRRAVTDDKGRLHYNYKRSNSIAYGSFVVEFGKGLNWKQLCRQSLNYKRIDPCTLNTYEIIELGRFPETPLPMININSELVVEPEAYALKQKQDRKFIEHIQQRLELTNKKEAYVYIHGYHSPFDDGPTVIAQLWHFMGRVGVPIAYSWPAGRLDPVRGYQYDRESGEFTLFHLKEFLKMLSLCPELEKIHIIAHSRGTDVITSALREIFIESKAAGHDPADRYKLGHVVLAAPDLDMEVAIQRIVAEEFYMSMDKMTMYVSKNDRMIGISDWVFSSKRRLGLLKAEDISEENKGLLNILGHTDIIDANVNVGITGHYYFYLSPAVSSDLILLLRDKLRPGEGRPLKQIENNFWQINEDYPNG